MQKGKTLERIENKVCKKGKARSGLNRKNSSFKQCKKAALCTKACGFQKEPEHKGLHTVLILQEAISTA